MHPQRYLGLLSISAEVPLPDEDADDEATLYVSERGSRSLRHARYCFTVKKNVKQSRPLLSADGRNH
jgi:hypothetical protein